MKQPIQYVKASNVPAGTPVVLQTKLHTVNVIEMTDGNLQSIRSFADNAEGNRQAERLFKRCVKENAASVISKRGMEDILDDGTWEDNGYRIFLLTAFNPIMKIIAYKTAGFVVFRITIKPKR